MPTISIITPVHPSVPDYLKDAYESLVAQELPSGWQWEWIVQQDGQDGAIASLVPEDPRISYGTGRAGGPGVARTLALARATGQYVKVLDADDQLPAGTLARDIAILDQDADIGWTSSRVLDLLPDGSTVGFDFDPPAGPIQRARRTPPLARPRPPRPGAPCDPVHAPAIAADARRLEGATSLRGHRIAARAQRGQHRLLHPGRRAGVPQMAGPGSTAAAAHVDPAERVARMTIIESRAEALLAYRKQISAT